MKHVLVPAPVVIQHRKSAPSGTSSEPMTMHDFVMDTICTSTAIGKGIDGVKRVRKLDRGFADKAPGDIVAIEDADYKAVMEVISQIQWSRPDIGAQLLPMLEAWEDAEKHDEEWRRKQNVKAVD
jgi:hypothetical protein